MDTTKHYLIVFFCFCFSFFSFTVNKISAVDFTYSADVTLTSTYVWRGLYNGGLSLQPQAYIGYKGNLSELSFGAWGNVGFSDWKFKFKDVDEEEQSFFVPELDLCLDFVVVGVKLGAVHYYYFGKSNFFSWGNINSLYEKNNTSQTEIYIGYDFSYLLDIPLSVTWNTMVAGSDGFLKDEEVDTTDYKRAYSTYIELNYELELPKDMSLLFQLGFTPWKSLYNFYNYDFSINNIGMQFNKSWFYKNDFFVKLFVSGSINPWGLNKNNVYIKYGGEMKMLQQFNGQIGLQIGI